MSLEKVDLLQQRQKLCTTKYKISLVLPKILEKIPIAFKKRGTFPCSFLKLPASITIEAALVLPLFLFAIGTMLYLFRVQYVNAMVTNSMQQVGRQISNYIVTEQDKEGVSKTVVTALLYSEMEKQNGFRDLLGQGMLFVDMEDSDVDNLKLKVSYRVKLPVSLLGIKGIMQRQALWFKYWNGESAVGTEDGIWVYITKSGTVYHINSACTYLKLSIRTVEMHQVGRLRNRSGEKYYACEHCGEKGQERVYITEEGNRYHTTLGCSGLKRTIYRISMEEVQGRLACSKCGKGDD